MSDKPIVLEQVLQICGYDLQFKTKPNISTNQLMAFFNDSTKIFKELDPEINDESEIYGARLGGPWWAWGFSFHYSMLEKFLNFKKSNTGDIFKDVVRTHSIRYQRNPLPTPDEIQNSHNLYKYILMLRPNLVLQSAEPTYELSELMERLQKLHYIGTSEKLSTFNPKEIRNVLNVALGKEPTKVLTLDGRVFDYMNNKFE